MRRIPSVQAKAGNVRCMCMEHFMTVDHTMSCSMRAICEMQVTTVLVSNRILKGIYFFVSHAPCASSSKLVGLLSCGVCNI